MENQHFLTHLKRQIALYPDRGALTDWQGTSDYTYRTMAEEMARLDILMTRLGVLPGDKVALCGRNSANWGVAFFAIAARRRVAVSILPDFTAEGILDLVNHSEAKAFFCGDLVWKREMDYARHSIAAKELVDVGIIADDQVLAFLKESLPLVQCIISLVDYSPLMLQNEALSAAFATYLDDYAARYPQGLCAQMTDWDESIDDGLIMINYTSGTTSSPKGVMISTRSLCSNVTNGFEHVSNSEGKTLVSILPMAHMYGLATEFIFQVTGGAHIYYLQKTPTPTVLMEAFRAIHPYMIVCVPLVLEKIFRQKVLPLFKKPYMRALLAFRLTRRLIGRKVVGTIRDALGGQIGNYMIGGAALNQEVETIMHKIGMPYTVGYGMTECGPLIAFADWQTFAPGSCGRAIERMEVRIDSEDPEHVPGEIQTRGDNMMLGYYKNEEATRAAFTEDGWLRTGDLGIADKKGNIFIKGRSKNLILGPSGQNIYPEEMEDKINSIPGVAESLVVERDGHIIALVYPDALYARRLGQDRLKELINQRLRHINRHLPTYSQIKNFEFVEQEFEKTPKRSIKRYLYK